MMWTRRCGKFWWCFWWTVKYDSITWTCWRRLWNDIRDKEEMDGGAKEKCRGQTQEEYSRNEEGRRAKIEREKKEVRALIGKDEEWKIWVQTWCGRDQRRNRGRVKSEIEWFKATSHMKGQEWRTSRTFRIRKSTKTIEVRIKQDTSGTIRWTHQRFFYVEASTRREESEDMQTRGRAEKKVV